MSSSRLAKNNPARNSALYKPIGLAAARDFVKGAKTGDVKLMRLGIKHLVPPLVLLSMRDATTGDTTADAYLATFNFFDQLTRTREWADLARRLADLKRFPRPTQKFFVCLLCGVGHLIRRGVRSDIALIEACSAVLPPYRDSRAVRLYRGQLALPRRSRAFGLLWSPSFTVAERFFNGWVHHNDAVILETLAPLRAIVSKMDSKIDYGDGRFQPEYIVDRQKLYDVKVVSRGKWPKPVDTADWKGWDYAAYFDQFDDDNPDADEHGRHLSNF